MIRKSATIFLIIIVTLLLFSGVIRATYAQVTASGRHQDVPADCPPAWNIVPSPSIGTHDYLDGVAALTASDVWAVGYADTSTLVEHWDGTVWSIIPSPSPGTSNTQLRGVTAISSSDVWAVGSYFNGINNPGGALIEHWNGVSWSVITSPSGVNYLISVSAVSPNDVWAVGSQPIDSNFNPVVEHWDGTSWTIVHSPFIGSNSSLVGVTALSSNNVWAVGYNTNIDRDSTETGITLVEHWNGGSWSVVASPSPGVNNSSLNQVAAISPDNVWAVGVSDASTLVEHWDGTSWSIISRPSPGNNSVLYGLAVVTSNDIWAVGYANNQENTLVEHWDGSSWEVISSPSPGGSMLEGVAALPTGDVWAVGGTNAGGGIYSTLVEHYNASGCATPTPGGPTTTPLPTLTPQPTVCPNPFVDINTSIFFPAINTLYCRGDVNGTDATHYSPTDTSTRGQFAKAVVLGFGLPIYTPSSGQDFTDVPPGYFAYTYIESGYNARILDGFDASTCAANGAAFPCFLPNIPITRGQLTKLVVDAAHYPYYTPISGAQDFTDVSPLNVFYVSIETAYSKGVVNGYPDGTFQPNSLIRRDEMAQIVYKGVTTP